MRRTITLTFSVRRFSWTRTGSWLRSRYPRYKFTSWMLWSRRQVFKNGHHGEGENKDLCHFLRKGRHSVLSLNGSLCFHASSPLPLTIHDDRHVPLRWFSSARFIVHTSSSANHGWKLHRNNSKWHERVLCGFEWELGYFLHLFLCCLMRSLHRQQFPLDISCPTKNSTHNHVMC